jgi:hypothetical protein
MAVNLSLLQYSRPLGQLEGSPKMPVSRVAPASSLPASKGDDHKVCHSGVSRRSRSAFSRGLAVETGGFVIE